MGLVLDDDTLHWTSSGRECDLSDAEHFCCKVTVQTMNSHASRTISDEPKCYNYYSYPRPNPEDWDLQYAAYAQKRWQNFLELDYHKHPIPEQIRLTDVQGPRPHTCTCSHVGLEDPSLAT